MKKILLVHLPFCTPASPSYSIAHLYSWLKESCDVEVLDLNLEYHKKRFPEYKKYFSNKSWDDYDVISRKFKDESFKAYSENHKRIISKKPPEFLDEFASMINSRNPDIVAFSIIYSSQAFYASALIPSIKAEVVAGGPSVNENLGCRIFSSELGLKDYLGISTDLCCPPDFSCFDLKDYFSPEPVLPIKTSVSCSYKQCTFCTHHNNEEYSEFPLKIIEKAITGSGAKNFFFIDDMILPKRLSSLSDILKGNSWACQLKPSQGFTSSLLKKLHDDGLKMVIWGVESGNDRILKLMNKGTDVKMIEKVLKDSNAAGIKNIVYIIFGFPSETREEFKDTIDFLKKNSDYIDLVSTSVFGLQKGTKIFSDPSKFGISKIIEHKRTLLGPTIEYEVSAGISQQLAKKMRYSHRKTLEKLDKFPKFMNFFREHMLVSI